MRLLGMMTFSQLCREPPLAAGPTLSAPITRSAPGRVGYQKIRRRIVSSMPSSRSTISGVKSLAMSVTT